MKKAISTKSTHNKDTPGQHEWSYLHSNTIGASRGCPRGAGYQPHAPPPTRGSPPARSSRLSPARRRPHGARCRPRAPPLPELPRPASGTAAPRASAAALARRRPREARRRPHQRRIGLGDGNGMDGEAPSPRPCSVFLRRGTPVVEHFRLKFKSTTKNPLVQFKYF